jgi:hypothetical protein
MNTLVHDAVIRKPLLELVEVVRAIDSDRERHGSSTARDERQIGVVASAGEMGLVVASIEKRQPEGIDIPDERLADVLNAYRRVIEPIHAHRTRLLLDASKPISATRHEQGPSLLPIDARKSGGRSAP